MSKDQVKRSKRSGKRPLERQSETQAKRQHFCYCTRTIAHDLMIYGNPQRSLPELTNYILKKGNADICQVVRQYLHDKVLSLKEVEQAIQQGYEEACQQLVSCE